MKKTRAVFLSYLVGTITLFPGCSKNEVPTAPPPAEVKSSTPEAQKPPERPPTPTPPPPPPTAKAEGTPKPGEVAEAPKATPPVNREAAVSFPENSGKPALIIDGLEARKVSHREEPAQQDQHYRPGWPWTGAYPPHVDVLSRDGHYYVLGGTDKRFHLINSHTGKTIATVQDDTLTFLRGVLFSPDNSTVVLRGDQDNVKREPFVAVAVDVSTGTPKKRFPAGVMGFSPDSKLFFTAYQEENHTRTVVRRASDFGVLSEIETPNTNRKGIPPKVHFVNDHILLVLSLVEPAPPSKPILRFHIYNVKQAKEILFLAQGPFDRDESHEWNPYDLQRFFSDDGKYAFVFSETDGNVWNLETGDLEFTYSLKDEEGFYFKAPVPRLFSRNGKYLALPIQYKNSYRSSLILLDLESKKTVRRWDSSRTVSFLFVPDKNEGVFVESEDFRQSLLTFMSLDTLQPIRKVTLKDSLVPYDLISQRYGIQVNRYNDIVSLTDLQIGKSVIDHDLRPDVVSSPRKLYYDPSSEHLYLGGRDSIYSLNLKEGKVNQLVFPSSSQGKLRTISSIYNVRETEFARVTFSDKSEGIFDFRRGRFWDIPASLQTQAQIKVAPNDEKFPIKALMGDGILHIR